MNQMTPLFQCAELQAELKNLHHLKASLALLSWDQETYMPVAAAASRAEQIELLSSIAHEKICSERMGDLLQKASTLDLSAEEKDILVLVQRDREKALKIPADLVSKLALTTSQAQQAWVNARHSGQTQAFLPLLERIFQLKHEEAACFEGDPYEVLLDQYEPGLTCAQLDPIFADLGPFLSQWTQQLSQVDFGHLQGPFPAEAQQKMGQELLQILGFDFEKGRLDISAHPFTMGMHSQDVRLTARYREDCLEDGLFSILHEGGHGLYEQGLPAHHAWNPLGEALSLGIHESQSRFWENQIGRSLAFWQKNFGLLQSAFEQLDLESFYRAIHLVKPSLIRVDADEVTYNLHVQLRYELEKALFRGEIKVGDLEGAWNELSQKLLGITPSHAFEGYLQDVHWSAGLIGYFPTYTLGNLAAAQWTSALEKDLGSLDHLLREGRELDVLAWMRTHIHQHGRRYTASQLLKNATSFELSTQPFKSYIDKKYSAFLG